jgi:hypothetical protein
MPDNEEVEEHVHEAREPFDKVVAATMAIIAAMLAAVSVLGQHFNTEELLYQQKSSDQWAFYQAKDIRRYSAQIAQDTFTSIKADPAITTKYTKDGVRYDRQRGEIQEQAREFEKESELNGRRANHFHIGEVFLESAIVFCSLSILTKARLLYIMGIVGAFLGIGFGATAWIL